MTDQTKPSLQFWITLSIAAALTTIGLKTAAYAWTGSVGLLSDALESLINLFAAVFAYWSLKYSARPVDAEHTYGHEKIEFFSSGIEGILIIVAGLCTIIFAVRRLIWPEPLNELGLGLAVAVVASAINACVGFMLIRVGKQAHSIVLEADGKHLLADVLTTAGVLAGLVLVWLTGIVTFDSVVAIIVGGNIIITGAKLIWTSFEGLMDRALPVVDIATIRKIIGEFVPAPGQFHALRTRRAGARRFIDFHLLLPGHQSIQKGHDLTVILERELEKVLPGAQITIHLEPLEDTKSFEDNTLKDVERQWPVN